MNELLWLTGLAVWVIAALCGACLLGWVVWCAVVAIDWMRWAILTLKGPMVWRFVPLAFLRRWAYFVTNGTDCTTWRNSGGEWSGFRQWTVYPPTSVQSPA